MKSLATFRRIGIGIYTTKDRRFLAERHGRGSKATFTATDSKAADPKAIVATAASLDALSAELGKILAAEIEAYRAGMLAKLDTIQSRLDAYKAGC